jgi:hypothetical protein
MTDSNLLSLVKSFIIFYKFLLLEKSPLSSPVESDLFNCFLRSSKLEVAK